MFMSILTVSRSNSVYTVFFYTCVSRLFCAPMMTQVYPWEGSGTTPGGVDSSSPRRSHSLVQFPKPNESNKKSAPHACDKKTDDGQIIKEKRTINQSRL